MIAYEIKTIPTIIKNRMRSNKNKASPMSPSINERGMK
jgi:hypothetical protein